MKLITLSGGLGNQMFQYAFYLALRNGDSHVYLYKNKIFSYGEHNGYELQRLFNVDTKDKGRWLTDMLLHPAFNILVRHLLFPVKIRERCLYDFAAYGHKVFRSPFYGIRLVGYWQSERYFENVKAEVRRIFTFPLQKMNEKTAALLPILSSQASVSIHIRRKDYLSASSIGMYGNVCDADYYRRAILYVRQKEPQARFYVFSDDLDWVHENVPSADNAVIVNWNRGEDSWQDMALMSKCRYNIIANSSFSWWGAWLNDSDGKMVVAPKTWIRNGTAPDVTPDSWIRL